MDLEWLTTCLDLLSSLKRRLLDSNTSQEPGDGIRFLSLVHLLKEAWLSFGNLWLQGIWDKFGVWKLLLSFVSMEWSEQNVFALLYRDMTERVEESNTGNGSLQSHFTLFLLA